MPSLTRRELIRLLGGAAALLASNPACSAQGSAATVLSDDERSALAALADAIIPPDDEPGGAALGAVDYIERVLTAFDEDLPRIFAGGPFSGRVPFPDATGAPSTNFPQRDFQNFIELDRINEASWRFAILGSAGLPNGGPNDKLTGPAPSLRDRLKAGLATAMQANDKSLAELTPEDLLATFNALPVDFKDLLVDLVTEAAFAAPEYGGNFGLAGWKLCHFEGDSQPLGYSQWNGQTHVERPDAPLSTPNPGADPAPIDADVDALLKLAIGVLGGKVAP